MYKSLHPSLGSFRQGRRLDVDGQTPRAIILGRGNTVHFSDLT